MENYKQHWEHETRTPCYSARGLRWVRKWCLNGDLMDTKNWTLQRLFDIEGPTGVQASWCMEAQHWRKWWKTRVVGAQNVQGSYLRLKTEASSTSTWLRALHTIFRMSTFVLKAIGKHRVDLSKWVVRVGFLFKRILLIALILLFWE